MLYCFCIVYQKEETKMEQKKFYITTAIAYTSRKPHIGNTYEVVLTDAIARFKRSMGYDVFFLTGTDEHGQKIEDIAKETGVTPQEYVDNIVKGIKELWTLMDISNDKFIRTTDEIHVKAVQKIFNILYEKGDIYKSEYGGGNVKLLFFHIYQPLSVYFALIFSSVSEKSSGRGAAKLTFSPVLGWIKPISPA